MIAFASKEVFNESLPCPNVYKIIGHTHIPVRRVRPALHIVVPNLKSDVSN